MLRKIDTKLMMMSFAMKNRVKDFLVKEDGAVDIVAIVVLIGIVVLVALIFRKRIEELINSLFDTIGKNASDAVNQ